MKKLLFIGFLLNFFVNLQAQENEVYRKITVAKDGNSEFTSIQSAIDATRDLGPGIVEIFIKNGVYNEKLVIPSWKHQLHLIGEDREKTIIQNNDYSGKTNPVTQKKYNTFTSYTFLVQGNDIRLENLSIKIVRVEKAKQ